jgi:hypothetical protein
LSADAPNVVDPPIASDAAAGVTATLATAVSAGVGVTLIDDVPEMPAVVAVIEALPAATAVATPAAVTETTDVAELDQVNVWPTTSFPAEFSAVARSVRFAPTAIDADGGSIATSTTRVSVTTLVATESSPPQATTNERKSNRARRAFSTLTRAGYESIAIATVVAPEERREWTI